MGYNTVNLSANTWYLVAPQFKEVSATEDTVDLLSNVTFSGLTAVAFASRASGAQIQIFNAATQTYTTYYYISDSKNGTAWARSKSNVPTTIPVTLGAGFWFKTGDVEESASITVSGSVKSETSKTVSIGTDGVWQILCNPYPIALDWSNVTTEGLEPATFADRATSAPQIQVFNASTQTYTTYYYISDSNEGTAWARSKSKVASGTLADVGQAFWVKAPTAGTLTFSFSN